jgi:hypothetical protein
VPPLSIPPSFKRELARKPVQLQAAILECVARLGDDPRHQSLQTHRVQGTRGVVFEAYVDRANRVTFHWDGPTIVLRKHCNHDMLQRRP